MAALGVACRRTRCFAVLLACAALLPACGTKEVRPHVEFPDLPMPLPDTVADDALGADAPRAGDGASDAPRGDAPGPADSGRGDASADAERDDGAQDPDAVLPSDAPKDDGETGPADSMPSELPPVFDFGPPPDLPPVFDFGPPPDAARDVLADAPTDLPGPGDTAAEAHDMPIADAAPDSAAGDGGVFDFGDLGPPPDAAEFDAPLDAPDAAAPDATASGDASADAEMTHDAPPEAGDAPLDDGPSSPDGLVAGDLAELRDADGRDADGRDAASDAADDGDLPDADADADADGLRDADAPADVELLGDADVAGDTTLPPECEPPPPLVINEVVASNLTGLRDEDGDASDWVELYNAGPDPLPLGGYALSDDPDEPMRWTLPDLVLGPDEYLLVFLSGKDRRRITERWDTRVTQGSSWRYRAVSVEPPLDWAAPSFDDSAWPEGPSGFGHADGDDATIVSGHTLYVRTVVTLSEAERADVTAAWLHVDYDDAFVAYLNGQEVARANIGLVGVAPLWSDWSSTDHEAVMYGGDPPPGFPLRTVTDLLRAGDNVLAIELHDVSTTSTDLTLIPFFTLGFAHEGPGAPDPRLSDDLVAGNLHADFALSSEGEQLLLTAPDGCPVDAVYTGRLYGDEALGRSGDGGPDWLFFLSPTPGAANALSEGRPGFAETPRFSPTPGFYPDGTVVDVHVSSPTATIRYTLDGFEPQPDDELWPGPLTVAADAAPRVLRARAYEPELWPSRIATASYFTEAPGPLAVLSLATDPPNFFDTNRGIYVLGPPDYQTQVPYFGANIWEDWERPLHLEFWEPDGAYGFSADAGVKIHGGWSRSFDQRSLRVHMRAAYGMPYLAYPLFRELPVTEFWRFLLRNSGNDWRASYLRDALSARFGAAMGLDVMAYRPVLVYLNGAFWGLHNLRERQDAAYLAAHHGVDPDAVDLLEANAQIVEGDSNHYVALLQYLRTHDMTQAEAYAYVQTQIETDNFASYEILQIFLDNTDWPGNNIRFWRPRTPAGRWRWLLYDTDFGLGIWAGSPSDDTVAFALRADGPGWPNPPWSTELLRRLMQNPEFRRDFINRFADWLNTGLAPASTRPQLAAMAAGIEAVIPAQAARWGGSLGGWQNEITVIHNWLEARPALVRQHLLSNLGLSGTRQVRLEVEPPDAGHFALTAVTVAAPYAGTYFEDVAIPVTAVPEAGYAFAGWSDADLPAEAQVWLVPNGDVTLTAYFEPAGEPPPPDVVIHEINYHAAATFDVGDWVELRNTSGLALDLSGWTLSDAAAESPFVIPAGTELPPDGYLVLVRDRAAFVRFWPTVAPVVGDFAFGLAAAGDEVRLYTPTGALYDTVAYRNTAPWPSLPDGGGPTLELRDPALDNGLAASWQSSPAPHGSPGAPNGSP